MEGLVSSSFWKGRRVLLTGHTGFKGGWLSLWLQRMGAELTGYSLEPPTRPSLFELANVASGMHSVTGDINDYPKLLAVTQACRPEIVLHLAAQPLVHAGYDDPIGTYETNVMGTVRVLEAVRQTKSVRAVVNVTTDKCYENREWDWAYREIDRLGGRDPYSNSKGCSELVTASYRESFFNPTQYDKHGVALASARAGNVIGGGDWGKDRLVPDMFRAIEQGVPVSIRRPNAVRPWQHVLEPLSGYLALAQRLCEQGAGYAEGWNFAPNESDAQSVRWIVEYLTSLWGRGASWTMDQAEYPHEAHFLKLSYAKAQARLGWQPRLNLKQALEWSVDWNRRRLGGEDLRKVCENQIETYEKLKNA